MKTILHISKYYYPDLGGIETVATYLAEGMSEYNNVVICFSTDDQYHEDEVHGVRVFRVPVKCAIASQSISFKYRTILKTLFHRYQPDYVHLHCPNPFIYPLILHIIKDNVKLVVHWHSDILNKGLLYTMVRPWEKKMLKRADMIIATSPNYIEASKPLLPYRDKVRVVQNGIIEDDFRYRPSDEKYIQRIKQRYSGKHIVFFCGRHIPYKGIDYLIKADQLIYSNCVILIGGNGPLDSKLTGMQYSDRVKFLGRLTSNELRQHLYAADVFAFPSITKAEAFGIALAEAMYCGCVPVCFSLKGSGVNWLLEPNKTGLAVPLGNLRSFARAVDILLTDKALHDKLSEQAKKRIRESFTAEKAVLAMNEVYKTIA